MGDGSTIRVALTIAGSDSSGGAGVQADLRTFTALGVYGVSAVTAITAQHTGGVDAVASLSADLVTAQIEAVAGDIEIHATKIGMLGTAAIVEGVVAAIRELELPLVVVDPVIVSSSGARLLDADGVQMLCTELFPCAAVVTPNIPEAEALSGCRITSGDTARRAAERIHDMGPGVVVITGGHAEGSDVVDLVYDGHAFFEHRTPRYTGAPVHGTGCAFSSALTSWLALGHAPADSAQRAQQFVAAALDRAVAVGRGARVLVY